MSDYVPNTDQIRNNVAFGFAMAIQLPNVAQDINLPEPGVRESAKQMFDEWLKSEKAKAWQEGYNDSERAWMHAYDGHDTTWEDPETCVSCVTRNPYREEV